MEKKKKMSLDCIWKKGLFYLKRAHNYYCMEKSLEKKK